jgi:hypothetical protein
MAAPPRFKRLSVEDFKEAPPWMLLLFQTLNEALGGLSDALSRRLTRSENMRSQTKDIEVETGASVADTFPLTIKLEDSLSDLAPQLVWPGKVDTLKGDPPTDAVSLLWRLDADGNVQITHIAGLGASQRYRVRLVIE